MLGGFALAQDSQFGFDPHGNLLIQTTEIPAPPEILAQPRAQPLIVGPGELASFFVVVADTRGLTYQWLFNGTNIGGATADALVVTNASAASEGPYSVVLANGSGSVTSAPAMLWFDGNGNGLPDSWELAYFGNLNQTATGDFDGDGISNLQEFLDGTNPTNSASARYHYLLTILSDGGSVQAVPNQSSYDNGAMVTLTATPSPPGVFHAWTGDILSQSSSVSLTMTTNKTVFAHFNPLDFTWTNSAGGDWNVSSNWTPNLVPGSDDNATINGTLTVTLNTAADCGNLTFGTSGQPTLTGNGTLTVYGASVWSGGTLGSAGSTLMVAANGGLTINGSNPRSFSGGTLINGGAGSWSAGQVSFANTAVFSNAPAGTFDFTADAFAWAPAGGTPLLANAGTLRKTGGTGATSITVPCNNSGSVQANSGTLALTLVDGTGSYSASANNTLSVSGTATLSPAASISGAGNFTVTSGAITNNGLFSASGSNTFSGGTFNQNGNCAVSGGAVVVNGGTVLFNGTGTVAPGTLSLSSGTLLGTMLVSVSGSSLWSGGTLGSAGSTLVVAANGGLTINGSNPRSFSGGTLVNGGAGSWSAGQVLFANTAVFSNAPAGTFDFTADGNAWPLTGGTPLLANAGTLRKTGGTGITTITVPCNNSGSVQANSGTLALPLADGTGSYSASANDTLSVSGTATLSPAASISGAGNFTVTAGAITNNGLFSASGSNTFSGGTFSQNGNCAVSGGAVVVNGGTVLFNGTGTVAPGTLSLSSGSLLGTMPVSVSGPSLWTGGTLGSAGSTLVLAANGGLTINGSGARSFLGGTLVNGGAGIWSAGQISFANTAVFSNAPAGTFDFTADGFAWPLGSGTPLLANVGTLRKTGGTSTTTITVPCNNSGSVQANSGTLALTLVDSSGSYSASANDTLSVSGTATLSSAASISGAGNFTVTSGAITNNGLFSASGSNTFSGGTFSQNGNCAVSGGAVVVNGGTVLFNGTGTVAPGTLSLSSGFLLGTMPVSVSGSSLWTGGTLGSAGSTLVVAANGGLAISGGFSSFLGGTLVNGGAGSWSAGQISFANTAVFSNAPAGTFDFSADGYAWALVSGTPLLANAGTLRKTGGTGTTTITVPCNNSGTVDIRTGILQANGGYASVSNSLLNCALGGTTAGTSYGQLHVNGAVTLNGELSVVLTNGYVPTTSDSFTVLTAGSRSNTFASFSYPSNQVTMQLSNTTSSVVVLVTAVAPPPPLLLAPTLSGSNVVLTWTAISNATYRVEFDPNLSPSNWTALTGDVTSLSNLASKLDPLTPSNRFYRVHVLP